MAFLRLAYFPDGTAEHWAAVTSAVGGVAPPEARWAFAAGPCEGGWQVMQLWRSRADLERFNELVFWPAMAAVGGRGFPHPPVVRDIETAAAWVGDRPLP